jgi:hypothetical protein
MLKPSKRHGSYNDYTGIAPRHIANALGTGVTDAQISNAIQKAKMGDSVLCDTAVLLIDLIRTT